MLAWMTRKTNTVYLTHISAGNVVLMLEYASGDAAAVNLDASGQEQIEKSAETVTQVIPGAPIRGFRLFGHQEKFADLARVLSTIAPAGKHVALPAGTELQFLPSEARMRVRRNVPGPTPGAVPTSANKKTRVLVVDDSETIRKLLSQVFSSDPQIECVGTIDNPLNVLAAIDRLSPDVITLDIHMPQMDGVTLLKRILETRSLPAVMISALSREEGGAVLDALEAGAVDYIQKPSLSELPTLAPLICEKIKNARAARVHRPRAHTGQALPFSSAPFDTNYLIAIGSSTGGTEALKHVLTGLPAEIPPIVIVQHIPPVFSKAFAERMNNLCPFEVKEAENGDLVVPGKVFIAPGGMQMRVKAVGADLKIVVEDTPPVNRHKPSVDVLFDSVEQLKRSKVVAGILTGMGGDGARGLLALRKQGAATFAQDEATSVVYGMPREAARLGAAQKILPLDQVAGFLAQSARKVAKAG